MSSGFWLNLQTRWDLYNAERAEAAALRKISKYRTSKKASSRN
jgi:plasmid maintenance system antidote protein VapI